MDGAPGPRLSVIIPTYNRGAQILQCLEAIAAQVADRAAFEVIVVNDGGAMLAQAHLDRIDDRIALRVLDRPHAGPAAARNAGARDARGIVLAFTDDDCRPRVDWVRKIDAVFADQFDGAIGGMTINALPNNLYSAASQLLNDVVYAHFNQPGSEMSFASNNFAVPKERFWAIGGFDERFPIAAQEDRDFCERWRDAGFPLQYVPEIQTDHAHALTLRSFMRQHFMYGRGACLYHRARSHRGAQPMAPDLTYYRRLLAAPWHHAESSQRGALVVLNLIQIVMNALGHIYQRTRPWGGAWTASKTAIRADSSPSNRSN